MYFIITSEVVVSVIKILYYRHLNVLYLVKNVFSITDTSKMNFCLILYTVYFLAFLLFMNQGPNSSSTYPVSDPHGPRP